MKKKFRVKKRHFWPKIWHSFDQKWRYFTWTFFQMPAKNFLYVQTVHFKFLKHPFRSVLHAGKKSMSIEHVVQKISSENRWGGNFHIMTLARRGGSQNLAYNAIFPPTFLFSRYFLNNVSYGHNLFSSVKNRSEMMFPIFDIYRLNV